jgi:trk system potassium uptake protein TrkH
MNYKKLGKILGKIMVLEGVLMLVPLLISLIYQEPDKNVLAFAVPAFALVCIGFLLQLPKPHRETLYQREGFALTALVWVVMAVFGAIPFVINGEIPSFVDACFEITSGFTTTGASIVDDIGALSHSTLFWRSFSHWIGGMGILVFVLIFIPEGKDGSSMHLLRAESPGPQVGKIVSKSQSTPKKTVVSDTTTVGTPIQSSASSDELDEETVAVIMAALMAYYQTNNPKCEFTVKRIKRI